MTGNRVIVGFILALLFLVIPTLEVQASYYPTRPGTIYYLQNNLTVGDTTTLDRMVLKAGPIGSGWLFVREPWSGSEVLAVYAPGVENIKPYAAIEVTGTVTIAGGKKVIRATGLRYYADKLNRPMLLLPKWSQFISWQYMRDIQFTPATGSIPTPPNPDLMSSSMMSSMQLMESESLSATAGTISAAKIDGGDVSLTGKVVTAVFYQPGTSNVQSFYVQEPKGSGYDYSGIKVVPASSSVFAEEGSLVSITGTMISGTAIAECYIQASSVTITGSTTPPGPIGLCQRSAAGDELGLQQALYLESSNPAKAGTGLNAVGTLVKAVGK